MKTNFSSSEFVRHLRRLLTLLQIPESDSLTLKAFRAGKATELAKAGLPLGKVMAAGEWKSGAVARYIDDDAVDAVSLMSLVAEASDGE